MSTTLQLEVPSASGNHISTTTIPQYPLEHYWGLNRLAGYYYRSPAILVAVWLQTLIGIKTTYDLGHNVIQVQLRQVVHFTEDVFDPHTRHTYWTILAVGTQHIPNDQAVGSHSFDSLSLPSDIHPKLCN